MIINWYPGHMASAKRMLAESLQLADAVILLLDARIPASTQNPDLLRLTSQKPVLTVLWKSDLADPQLTKRWLDKLSERGEALECSTKSPRRADITAALGRLTAPVVQHAAQRGYNKTVRAMVVGIPNCGKSTMINLLAGQTKAKTGNKPGVTRSKQWIKLNDRLELMDSPGLLWPRLDNQTAAARLACTGAINDDILDREELAAYLAGELAAHYPQLLDKRYSVQAGGSPADVLSAICVKRGLLVKGGQPDTLRGAVMLLDEFRSGKIGRITLDRPEGANG